MTRQGLIDLQVNGYLGISFTEPGLTVNDVRKVTFDLLARGTLAYCPTVVTGPEADYERNFAVIAEAMADPEIGPHLLGIHLEGPFISTQPGAYGAHQPQYIQAPSVETFARFQRWAKGRIAILTLAPEREGAEALIRAAADQGVIVSIGHHLADEAAMHMAVRAGVRFLTHVANGIPNEIPRHHNPIWLSLAEDALVGGFITDGHHLPPALIKVALRAKTPARFIVTSDVAPLGGMPPGTYTSFGKPMVVEACGRIASPASQSLGGSYATQLDCLNYLAALELLDEAGLWQVGYDNPLALLGRDPAAFAGVPGPGVTFADGRFRLLAPVPETD